MKLKSFLLVGLVLSVVAGLLPSSAYAVSCGLSDNATNTLNTACVIDGAPFTEGGSTYYSGIAGGDMVVSGADITVSPGVTMTWSPGKAIMIQNGGRIIRGANAVLKQVDPMAWFRQQLGFDAYAAGVPVKILGQNLHVCTADPCTVTAPEGTGSLIIEGTLKFGDGTTQTTAVSANAGLAQGSIVFYNGTSCPTGYNEVTGARGRTVVGLPAAGTLAGTVGTALTNLEDRTHTHTGPSHTHTGPSHTHTGPSHTHVVSRYLGAGYTNYLPTGHLTITNPWNEVGANGDITTSASGTGATSASGTGDTGASGTGATGTAATSNVIPYVQYIVCEAASGAGSSGNGWNDLGSTVVLATTGDSVGIGTTSVTSKLTVAGTVESTTGGFKFPDATTQTSAASPETSGQIAFFATTCPSGWTEYTAARGMYIVGNPASGTLATAVGTALTNLQDPTHTHTYNTVIAHSHSFGAANGGGGSTTDQYTSGNGQVIGTTYTTSTGSSSGTTAATSATMPYIQLLWCKKN